MTIAKHIKEHAVLGPFALASGLAAHEADVANPHVVTAAQLGLSGPMDYIGSISVAADFPTVAAVSQGDTYSIAADVTDNDVTKTNTGDIFYQYDEITWDGSDWVNLGNSTRMLGNFATNKLAFENLIARKLDTNGDGTGDPVTGQSYYNTTYKCHRTFDGTIWRGIPSVGPSIGGTLTIYVDQAAGSDTQGDGLTAPTAYATLAAAAQDCPGSPSSAYGDQYVISLVGDLAYPIQPADFRHLRAHHLSFPSVNIQGPETDLTTFSVGVAGLVTIQAVTQDSRAEGRVYDIDDGPGMVAHTYINTPCEVVSCAATPGNVGKKGMVYDNGVAEAFIVFEPETAFTFAAGDTIQMLQWGASLTPPAFYSTWDHTGLIFSQLTLDAFSASCGGAGHLHAENCLLTGASTLNPQYDGRASYKNCGWKNTAGGQVQNWGGADNGITTMEGYIVQSCWDGARQDFLMAGRGMELQIKGEFVFAHMGAEGWKVAPDLSIGTWGTTAEGFILLHDCSGDFLSVTAKGAGKPLQVFLPQINTPTAYPLGGYLVDVTTNVMAIIRAGSKIEFMATPVTVTAGATANLCRIDGESGGYVARTVEGSEKLCILGTENLKRVASTSVDYTILTYDGIEMLLVDCNGADKTITLPPCADNIGRPIIVKKVDAGADEVIVEGDVAGETIDGHVDTSTLANPMVTQYMVYIFTTDGSDWYIS